MRHHLTTTRTTGLQALGAGRRRVVDLWSELNDYLTHRLDGADLELLAEPQRKSDTEIAWFTARQGNAVPLTSLPKRRRAKVIATVARRRKAYEDIAAQLRQSSSRQDNEFGRTLFEALCMPERNALDNVWVVGDEPVFVNWGMRDNLPGVVAQPLDLGRVALVDEGRRPDLLPWLLWLAFLTVCALLWARLLPACGVIDETLGFCVAGAEPEAPVEPLVPDTLLSLLDETAYAQRALARPVRCDSGTAAYLDDGRPLRIDGGLPTTEPGPDPISEENLPSPVPDSGTDSELGREGALELNTMLSRLGAFACDTELVLRWSEPSVDLDLLLVCPADPNGGGDAEEAATVSVNTPQNCGATYDLDSAEGSPGEALDRICFDGDAWPGEYVPGVLRTASEANGSDSPLAYTVIWRNGTESATHDGVITAGDEQLIPFGILPE